LIRPPLLPDTVHWSPHPPMVRAMAAAPAPLMGAAVTGVAAAAITNKHAVIERESFMMHLHPMHRIADENLFPI
jgi:hypothetical protein